MVDEPALQRLSWLGTHMPTQLPLPLHTYGQAAPASFCHVPVASQVCG